MFRNPQYKMQIKGDKLDFCCQDDRLIAEGLPEIFTKFSYINYTTDDLIKFIGNLTAAFWQKGKREGREEVSAMMKKIKEYEQKILDGNFDGTQWW